MKIITTLILMLLPIVGFSQELNEAQKEKMSGAYKSVPLNNFRFVGNQLVCKADNLNEYACHRIGRVRVGDKFEPQKDAWKSTQLSDGIVADVFPIVANDEYEAYWVVGHKDGRIVSVQLTGNYPHEDLTFATLKLGDSKMKVREVLGTRYRESIVSEIQGVVWDYAPFNISIEFVDDVIYSMRVSE